MDRKAQQSVCEQVYRQFPEVAGCAPKVQSRPGNEYLLIFQGEGAAAGGRKIPRIVRVVAGPDGKIVKITTSR
jgi:hypothetical protein